MKKFITLYLIVFTTINATAQNKLNNSLSTSLIRFEKNSQSVNNIFTLKFLSGIAYQRTFNKWDFGFKYEYGLNAIKDIKKNGNDFYNGTGLMKESNFYVTSHYSFANYFNSKIVLSTGLSLYYSYINYSGVFSGGLSGNQIKVNNTYNTIGFSPNFNIKYYPINRLFIALNTNIRYGFNSSNDKFTLKIREVVVNSPELRIGVKF